MTIGIVIPYRGTDLDKSRLRKDLDEDTVSNILYKMTQQVISEIMKINRSLNLYILSKNSVSFTGNYQTSEDQGLNLNNSLKIFTQKMEEEIIMIIMADLPLITNDEIEKILDTVEHKKNIIIAPAADKGTSILCYNRKNQFPFFYGVESAKKLADYLSKNKIAYQVLDYDYRYQDIDTLKDLRILNQNISLPKWLKKYFKEDLK